MSSIQAIAPLTPIVVISHQQQPQGTTQHHTTQHNTTPEATPDADTNTNTNTPTQLTTHNHRHKQHSTVQHTTKTQEATDMQYHGVSPTQQYIHV